MGKSSAPPAPDYAAAAKATASGNMDAARQATAANRVDTYTPYGSLTYTNEGGKKASDWVAEQDAYRQKDATYQKNAEDPTWKAANAEEFHKWADANNPYKDEQDKWTSTVKLDPAQQQLLDQQNKTSLNLAGLQDSATSRVGDAMSKPFDMSNVPEIGMMGSVLDRSSLPGYRDMGSTYTDRQKLAGTYDPRQDTNNATQAILSRVAPQLQRDKAAMDTQLANQGIVQGSEAYKNAQDQFGRQANDAYTQASLQGINLGMGQQGQMFGQTLQNAGFRQGEQAQRFGQENTNYGNSAAQRAQATAEQGQEFGQQNTNYGNSVAARQQAIQEQAYLRSLPLNELNSLRTGAQVTNPTFTNAPQQQTTAGPNLLDAMGKQYGAAVDGVNASNASSANTAKGVMSAAAIAAAMF